jgi:hypothetical protein
MLILGHLAAHVTNFLVLLPSGPDTVQSVPLRKTKKSSHQIMDCSDYLTLAKGLNPAIADCRYKEPLTPRLAQSNLLYHIYKKTKIKRIRSAHYVRYQFAISSNPTLAMKNLISSIFALMAERVGFEPTTRFPVHPLSRRAPSTNSAISPNKKN